MHGNAPLRSGMRLLSKGAALLLSLTLLTWAWGALFTGTSAEASAERYYPAFCLGGWQKTKLASGDPQVHEGASDGAFNVENSAYLGSDVSAQIFCGYFPVERTERQPISARIHFNWAFIAAPVPAGQQMSPSEESLPTDDGAQADQDEQQSGTQSLPSSPDADVQEESAPPAEASEGTTEAQEDRVSDPETPPADTPAQADPAPASVPDPAPAAESAPAPAPAPAPSEPTSFKAGIRSLLGVAVAHAQEVTGENVSLADILEVRYSVDGTTWHSAGRVTRDGWYRYSVEVPVHSWDDMENLQIAVATLPTLETRPAIYLESMGLSVEVDRTIGEVVEDGMETVADVAEAIAEAPDALASAITALFTDEPLQETPSAPVEEPVRAKRLAFAVSGATRAALSLPDALSNAFIADDVTGLPAPDVSVRDDGATLTISGACRKPYFVVLTFRNAEDYAENPRAFVANYAGPCEGGSFTYDVKNIPLDTVPGTYYLVVGEQEGEGSWGAVTSPIPVDISAVVE